MADHPNDVNGCCKKMFIKWLLMKPDATWGQLVTALTRIGMNAVAADLKNQLKKGNISLIFAIILCIGKIIHLLNSCVHK